MPRLTTVEEIVEELQKRQERAERLAQHYTDKGRDWQIAKQNTIWCEMHDLLREIREHAGGQVTVEEIVAELGERLQRANKLAVHYAMKVDPEQVARQNTIWWEMRQLLIKIEG